MFSNEMEVHEHETAAAWATFVRASRELWRRAGANSIRERRRGAVTVMRITRATFTAADPSRDTQSFDFAHQAGIPKLQLVGLPLLAEGFARNFSLVNIIPREVNSPP
jgi:hypothetical protein